MRSANVTKKVILAVMSIAVLCILLVLVYSYNLQKNIFMERRMANQHVVQTAYSVVAYYGGLVQQGTLTKEEAQRMAMEVVKTLRYKTEEYFWINDLEPRMIMHPFKPELDGKNIGDVKDPEGTFLFREMVAVCRAAGEGFVEYMWPRPGSEVPLKKLSFVKLYQPWGWIIGSGNYLEDIHRELGWVRNFSLIILSFFTAGIIWLYIWTRRAIAAPIKNVSAQLLEIGGQLEKAAAQVSSASQILAQTASEQAASLEETSSSLEEMSSMTRQNADNARQADSLMKDTHSVIGRANESMGKLTGSMEDISRSSMEISKIIKTIDEIAFQTNLLALNAAVEAARAGAAGAGFAVVADEVRNLAGRSAEAAKNTADLIEGTVARIAEGTGTVKQTNEDFSEVSSQSANVAGLISDIAASSAEQSQGIEQVNRVVTEMDKVTQQNAATAEESSSASQELQSLAEQLKQCIQDLGRLVGESGQDAAGAHPQDGTRAPDGTPSVLRRAITAVSTRNRS